MSSCYFYSIGNDIVSVLDFVFAETQCEVFEGTSELGANVRRFRNTASLAATF